MFRLLVTLAVLGLVFGQTRLTSSGTWSDIVSPASASAVEVDRLNQFFSHVIPEAKWIWDNKGLKTPKGDTVKVEHLFWSKCSGPAVLSVAAYGNWWVYIDGKLVKNGNTWKEVTKIEWAPSCGKHNITIIVTKTISNDWAGLTFILLQDKSKCSCNSNGWLNPYTCKCQCLNKCDCPSNKFWVAYPSCSCKCKPQKSTTSRVGTIQAYTAALCPKGQYWSPVDCMCMCSPIWCPSGWYYNKKPEANGDCKCWPIIL